MENYVSACPVEQGSNSNSKMHKGLVVRGRETGKQNARGRGQAGGKERLVVRVRFCSLAIVSFCFVGWILLDVCVYVCVFKLLAFYHSFRIDDAPKRSNGQLECVVHIHKQYLTL